MPFDTALSGIRAASSDLSITGNNIANASTTGFKASRAEFGDVYATSVLGAGVNAVGSGVRVQDVAQRFSQGNVSFTENELDLAINGNGFFVVSQQGETLYTRAGSFGLDSDGYVVNNTNARLQGFSADADGNIGGISSDVRIQTSNLAPRQTTGVESLLNLDSTDPVLQSTGQEFTTEGTDIGVAQAGLQTATTTTLQGLGSTLPLESAPGVNYDFAANPMEFEVSLSGSSGGGNGTVTVYLDASPPAGSGIPPVPTNITNLNELRTLVSAINSQLFEPSDPGESAIDVLTTVEQGTTINDFSLSFEAMEEGQGSAISFGPVASGDPTVLGLNTGLSSTAGIPAVSNGYPQQSIDFVAPDGSVVTYTSQEGATAATTASEMNAIQGVSATARTSMTITDYAAAGDGTVTLNGVALNSDTLTGLETEINALTGSTLPGISATLDSSGNLQVNSTVGDDLRISFTSDTDGDSITVLGDPDAAAQTLEYDDDGTLSAAALDADNNSIIVGGTIDMVLDEGYSLENPEPPSTRIFQPLSPAEFTPVVINAFDPTDQSTYNNATSMTIYDSLGNDHVMTQYFVKQPYNPADPTTAPNHWQMHIRIDGQDVGDPDTTLPPPQNTQPTMATYNLYFNEDGSINSALSDNILISNWTPRDEDGNPNGALGPQNVLAGGTTDVPDPPTSSNFVVDMNGTTQFGSEFSVNDVSQNGYSTGRLSGLSISEDGIIFARYTNGQSLQLAQVSLADFSNQQGLQPMGDTMWAETFDSGAPNVGTPGSAALGAIQSGALEESNVDLSAQLVNLIIAQRNFQASAKTIETADSVTQTIINLR